MFRAAALSVNVHTSGAALTRMGRPVRARRGCLRGTSWRQETRVPLQEWLGRLTSRRHLERNLQLPGDTCFTVGNKRCIVTSG